MLLSQSCVYNICIQALRNEFSFCALPTSSAIVRSMSLSRGTHEEHIIEINITFIKGQEMKMFFKQTFSECVFPPQILFPYSPYLESVKYIHFVHTVYHSTSKSWNEASLMPDNQRSYSRNSKIKNIQRERNKSNSYKNAQKQWKILFHSFCHINME